MLLMLKDIPVMRFDFEAAVSEVYRADLLPYSLKNKVADLPEITVHNITQAVAGLANTRSAVQSFLARRVLTLSRIHAKEIYNMITGDPSQSDSNKKDIALKFHSVSINDCYWTKEDDSSLRWQDVNIHTNSLNEILADVALNGTVVSLQGSLCSPEITTDGTMAKGWRREQEDLWLYKKGKTASVEVAVSKILDNLNVAHVQYFEALDHGEYCCRCKCMETDSLSVIAAAELRPYCVSLPDDYAMWIVDYLISNTDRHEANFGYYVSSVTNEIITPHPLFDHDRAFNKYAMKHPDVPYRAKDQYTLREAAHAARAHVTLHYKRDFTRSDFQTDEQYESFMERLSELQIICEQPK